MKNISTAFTSLLICLSCSVVAADQSRIDKLISQLSHERYVVREAASHRLVKEGIQVVPDLIKICLKSDAEISYRALLIVERIGLEGDPEDLKFVVEGLELLSRTGHPELIARSKRLAGQYDEYKSQLALKELRRLGAHVQEYDANNGFVPGLDIGARGVIIVDGRVVVANDPAPVEVANKTEPELEKPIQEIDEREFERGIEELRNQIRRKRASEKRSQEQTSLLKGYVFCCLVQQEAQEPDVSFDDIFVMPPDFGMGFAPPRSPTCRKVTNHNDRSELEGWDRRVQAVKPGEESVPVENRRH